MTMCKTLRISKTTCIWMQEIYAKLRLKSLSNTTPKLIFYVLHRLHKNSVQAMAELPSSRRWKIADVSKWLNVNEQHPTSHVFSNSIFRCCYLEITENLNINTLLDVERYQYCQQPTEHYFFTVGTSTVTPGCRTRTARSLSWPAKTLFLLCLGTGKKKHNDNNGSRRFRSAIPSGEGVYWCTLHWEMWKTWAEPGFSSISVLHRLQPCLLMRIILDAVSENEVLRKTHRKHSVHIQCYFPIKYKTTTIFFNVSQYSIYAISMYMELVAIEHSYYLLYTWIPWDHY